MKMNSTNREVGIVLTCPDHADLIPDPDGASSTYGTSVGGQFYADSIDLQLGGEIDVLTNVSGQIGARILKSGMNYHISTVGYFDPWWRE